MNTDQHIQECKFRYNQIQLYDPDPMPVSNLLFDFATSTDRVFDSIFEDADTDFGLFTKDKITEHSFRARSLERNDQQALAFCNWFTKNYANEHQMIYPSFIDRARRFIRDNKRSPTIKIMMISRDRYHGDPAQELVGVHGRIRSKIHIHTAMRHQLPTFLMHINNKRTRAREPKVSDDQVIATTFAEIGRESMEVIHSIKTYIPLMIKIKDESRVKINEFRS